MCNDHATYPSVTSQQAVAQPTPASATGCFKLQRGHAMTLTLKAAGELRLAHGSAWVTFTEAANDVTAMAGDHFLNAGQTMPFKAGQTVVLEALGALKDNVYFDVVVQAKGLVTLSRPATQTRPVLAWALGGLGYALEGLATMLFGLAQSARAFGQTGPHPSGAAALGCQS